MVVAPDGSAWLVRSNAHTVLHINKALLANYSSATWDEATIRARGASLAERVKTVWPPGPVA